MTLKLRFILLIGLLLALFLGGVYLLNSTHRAETSRVVQAAQQERSRLLDEVLSLVGYPLNQFTRDYSLWDEMANFVAHPNPKWADININASLESFRLRAVWVLRTDGSLVHAATPPRAGEISTLPFPTGEVLAKLSREPFAHFYTRIGDELCEIRASPIQPSSDITRASPPLGWLLAAFHWDNAHLATLGKLIDATATLRAQPGLPESQIESGGFDLIRPLPGLDGNAVRYLRFHYNPPNLSTSDDFNRDELLIFALQGLLLIVVTTVCIHAWILSPVKKIITSLREDKPDAVAPLAKHNDETGLIARLVQSHFADRRALERNERALAHTLAERVRLGRDLHDNVIQSLFATGMGLASTQSLVRSSPALVEEGLEQVRATLNEVIRDVRTFIVGLEPDSLQSETFAQAVAHLVDALRSIRPLHFDVDIDDHAALILPPDLRQHALQIVRESLLNSIRHAGATRIQLSLHGSIDNVILALTDDGASASPEDNSPTGLGLSGVAARARLVGAQCEITRLPERGTRVQIRYSQTTPSIV
jgi:signal transduction histidine kinase